MPDFLSGQNVFVGTFVPSNDSLFARFEKQRKSGRLKQLPTPSCELLSIQLGCQLSTQENPQNPPGIHLASTVSSMLWVVRNKLGRILSNVVFDVCCCEYVLRINVSRKYCACALV